MAFCKRSGPLAVALACSIAVGTASSFTPVSRVQELSIPRPGSQQAPDWRTVALDPASRTGAARFQERLGGSWYAQWNPRTATPHALFGSGAQLSASPLTDEAQVEALARSFAAEHADLLRVDPAELSVRSVKQGLGKWGVIFDQLHRGVPVEGSRLRLGFTESGRLIYVSSDWHPGVDVNVQPVLGSNVARDIAGRDIGFVAGRDTEQSAELLILPVPAGEASLAYRLVWRNRLEVADPYGIWTSFVDAQTGTILARESELHFVNVVGTTAGNVEDFGYCYAEEDRRMPNMKVNVTGGNSGYSDLNGVYNIIHPGALPVTVTAQLDGRWINVNNQQQADANFSGQATPGTPFEIRWTDANSQDTERDAYLHGNRIHDVLKYYDPGFISGDYRMSANVNINSSCNAFWNGSSINFYRAGGGCGNTGQMGDVIYHEYAHGITQWIYGTNPSDVGEGNSDIAAILIDGNSIIGEGFYLDQCASGIRDAENTLRYPEDYQAGQIHFNGQIVSGFWWDARQVLVDQLGEQAATDLLWPNWHVGRVVFQPVSMPDQVFTAFLMDDDDGDFSNGTPHYDAFCPAASNHGFDSPGPAPVVTVAHNDLHNQVYDGNGDVVRATVTSSAAPISSVALEYAVDGVPIEILSMSLVGLNLYEATIPPVSVGHYVEYAIRAEDANGNGGAYPPSTCTPSEPSGVVRYYVATSVDEMEVASGWTVGGPADDAVTGVWERVDPNGTGAQPENDQTPLPGVFAWVTGQCPPGCGLGDNDVDGGQTTLNSPTYDLTGATTAKVLYYRWYSNNMGSTPGTDFWVVDASNDNGGSWVNVENTNVTTAAWTPVEVDLNALFGGPTGSVKLRFIASDEGDGSLVEAGVDEFLVFVNFGADAPVEQASGLRFALHPARPNPFGAGTQVAFELPAAAAVRASIHDPSGRLVRGLSDGAIYGPGQNVLHWDGRDGAGREVAAGVYYLRLRTEGFAANRTLIVQR